MIRAIVGAGGKTTYIRNKVKDFLAQGKKVFVTTSTHMYIDEDTLLTDDAERIIEELLSKRYVMAGSSAGGKLSALSYETYLKVCECADEVLIEADGSKHFPLKFPNEREPVIYDNVDEIVVISGEHGIWKRAEDTIHRWELSKEYGVILEKDTIITPDLYENIVTSAYLEPLRRRFPNKRIIHESNKKLGIQIGCMIMASGQSKRFGCNKLLAELGGKTLIEHILDKTQGLFNRCIVLTRTEEVKKICECNSVEVIFHDKEYRNDAIKLGMEQMEEMDACMFCVCDQPFLKRESIIRMNSEFAENKKDIYRLSNEKGVGSPVLFAKEYFEALKNLPEKKGGSYIAELFPENVHKVYAIDEKELLDIDTKEEYDKLCNVISYR